MSENRSFTPRDQARMWIDKFAEWKHQMGEKGLLYLRLDTVEADELCDLLERLSVPSEREETVPDFDEDFEGAVEAICDQVVDDLKKHPEPEYWIAKSAARLAHFVKIKAPNFIIEGEKRLLQRRVMALPIYCADYDALKSEAGDG